MAHILDLPSEIVLLIFQYYLETETQKFFYNYVRKVCKEWEIISQGVSLWRTFDGSLSFRILRKFCREGRMNKTEELILSTLQKSEISILSKIFVDLPSLRSITFKIGTDSLADTLTSLGENCQNLSEIKFACSDSDFPTIKFKRMENFFKLRGQNLSVIDISGATIMSCRELLCGIAHSCPNLTHLLIQNSRGSYSCTFPITTVQMGCPKLKVLRLGTPITFSRDTKNDQLSGFPDLEVFTHPSYEYFTNENLLDLLSKSPNLKVLDIRGCSKISVEAIISLPATHLESMYLSNTRLHTNKRIVEIFHKWNKSLRIVDLSRMKSDDMNDMLLDVLSLGQLRNLEYVDLNNTLVSIKTVMKIIENCENLSYLNLSSCREMGRGKMRDYPNKESIERLHQDLM